MIGCFCLHKDAGPSHEVHNENDQSEPLIIKAYSYFIFNQRYHHSVQNGRNTRKRSNDRYKTSVSHREWVSSLHISDQSPDTADGEAKDVAVGDIACHVLRGDHQMDELVQRTGPQNYLRFLGKY